MFALVIRVNINNNKNTNTRTKLAEAGLIGKISFSSEWFSLRGEITAIFRATFGLSENQSFPFPYLGHQGM